MSCYRPLEGWVDPITRRTNIGSSGRGYPTELPCFKCVGCMIDRARGWSIRIGHEAQCWDSNWFVTLDYAPEHLLEPGLQYGDFQDFMRTVRRDLPKPVRFFVSGEYGPRTCRPHWHAILFNAQLEDAREFENGTFRSELVESSWGRGNAVLGSVTPESISYVAGYCQEKWKHFGKTFYDGVTGEVLRPAFSRSSLKPGIGAKWYERYSEDLWGGDIAVQGGKTFKPPRYYVERLRKSDPLRAEEIIYERIRKATEDVDPAERTPERREVREKVAMARVSQQLRGDV